MQVHEFSDVIAFSRSIHQELQRCFPGLTVVFHRVAEHDYSTIITVPRTHEDAVLESLILALPELLSPEMQRQRAGEKGLRKLTAKALIYRESFDVKILKVVDDMQLEELSTELIDQIQRERIRIIEEPESYVALSPEIENAPSKILVQGLFLGQIADYQDRNEGLVKCVAFADKAAAYYQEFAVNRGLPPLSL